ncbi:MAG: hypothetical protein DI587_17170 [Variovorax paradoxus]|nr:MAG: hypothetical protein DI583_17170 [Variovorax paradoxus]PZQ08966.1 MAG: hypothetical protein DI587_17170 [Variovorax paradoxus]
MGKQHPAQRAAGLVRRWEDCIAPHELPKWAEEAALTLRALVVLQAAPTEEGGAKTFTLDFSEMKMVVYALEDSAKRKAAASPTNAFGGRPSTFFEWKLARRIWAVLKHGAAPGAAAAALEPASERQKLRDLADRIDPEQLWRRSPMDRFNSMTPEQVDRLDAGVALRRYAELLEPMRWLVFPPTGSVRFSASTLAAAAGMAQRHETRAVPVPAGVVQVCPECDIADCRHIRAARALNFRRSGGAGKTAQETP